jgi:hypothetical protein
LATNSGGERHRKRAEAAVSSEGGIGVEQRDSRACGGEERVGSGEGFDPSQAKRTCSVGPVPAGPVGSGPANPIGLVFI